MSDHKQVEIYSQVFEQNIEVDEGIAELIELLGKLDIMTNNSCQENKPGIMWIDLPSVDAERFLSICASHRAEDLDNYENSLYGRMVDDDTKNSWRYDVCLDDFAEKVDEEKDEVYYEGNSEISIEISVRFPVSDYPIILERIREHLESLNVATPNAEE